MPKLRTKSAITKRFKLTKTGKVIFKTVGDAKLHANKSRAKKRRYHKTEVLQSKSMTIKIKKALGQ